MKIYLKIILILFCAKIYSNIIELNSLDINQAKRNLEETDDNNQNLDTSQNPDLNDEDMELNDVNEEEVDDVQDEEEEFTQNMEEVKEKEEDNSLNIDLQKNPLSQTISFLLHPKILQTLITLYVSGEIKNFPKRKLPEIKLKEKELNNLNSTLTLKNSQIIGLVDDLENQIQILEDQINRYETNMQGQINILQGTIEHKLSQKQNEVRKKKKMVKRKLTINSKDQKAIIKIDQLENDIQKRMLKEKQLENEIVKLKQEGAMKEKLLELENKIKRELASQHSAL